MTMMEQGIQCRGIMDITGRVWRSVGAAAQTLEPAGGNVILAVLVFLPFLMGLAVYGAGRTGGGERDGRGISRTGRVLAVCAVTAQFLLMLLAAGIFYRNARLMPPRLYEPAGTALECVIPGICGFGLHFCMDGLRLIYGVAAAFMWLMTTLFSGEYFARHRHVSRFYLFLLWTLGAVMGVFLSADLMTTFIFFEIMSFTSYVWVTQEENTPSLEAADTYLAVAVLGGLVMLMGIFLLYRQLGTLEIAGLLAAAKGCENKEVLYAAGICMLVGFGAKAGAFPLHIWLPKAHPVAPAPASALLSGILTKTGIYGILLLSCQLFAHDGSWGMTVLALGVVTMVLGAVLAVFSLDLKRTLACSSMSQIGFILVGIGMQGLTGEGNELAVHGTLLHMVNHSLIKLVLFMAAGVIYFNVHELDLNVLRGYGRKKPLLKGIFLTGALALGGVPLSAGYVSKTLLHESIVEYGGGSLFSAVEGLFLVSGGLTAAYMTKLFVAVFVEKNQDADRQAFYEEKKPYMNPVTGFALTGSAAVLLLWGLVPRLTMDPAARLGQDFMGLIQAGEEVAYYSPENLAGALISLGIGAAVYLAAVRGGLMRCREASEGGGLRVAGCSARGETRSARGGLCCARAGEREITGGSMQAGESGSTVGSMQAGGSGSAVGSMRIREREKTAGSVQAGNGVALGVQRLIKWNTPADYTNPWPAWLDLEKLLYRPVLLSLLPLLFGIVCRLLDSAVDLLVVALRRTLYRDSPLPRELPEGNVVTEALGHVLNGLQWLGNHTWKRRFPTRREYVHLLAMKHAQIKEDGFILRRSLSFGLLLVCLGLGLTLVYILLF